MLASTRPDTRPQEAARGRKVLWDRADQQISGTLLLLDADGQAVEVETSPGNNEPIEIRPVRGDELARPGHSVAGAVT